MSLHKILRIITTIPLPSNESSYYADEDAPDGNKMFEFDLNVGFSGQPELDECLESGLSSDRNTGGVGLGEEESPTKIEKTENGMTLLIEAAELIFGEFKYEDKFEFMKKNNSRRSELKKDEMAAEELTAAPLIRSIRGRTQSLPLKYRDSVIEPLTRNRSSILLPKKRSRR